jgi:flagellin
MLASNANRMYGLNNNSLKTSTEKLSSGYRINRSADDAAGLAVSETMRRQIRGLSRASANAQDGISMAQAAEGGLVEAQEMLHRMNELCVNAASDLLTAEDRDYIQEEINQSIKELDRLSNIATFNDINMLGGRDGDLTTPFQVTLQVGTESDSQVSFEISSINASILGVSDIDVRGNDGAGGQTGIEKLKDAISHVSRERSKLGAVQNRLAHAIKNMDNIVENTTASESRVRDTDMATEMVNRSIRNILSQASVSVSAQANQSNQGVMGLING